MGAFDMIVAPKLGEEWARQERAEALDAQLARVTKHRDDLVHCLDMVVDRVDRDGAVILAIRGKQYRVEPAGAL